MNHVISKTPTVRVITGLTDMELNNYPENIWLKNNGGHDLPDCEPKYMKWHDPETFDYVVEMSVAEKVVIDSSIISNLRTQKILYIKNCARIEIEKDEWKLARHERQKIGDYTTTITDAEYNLIIQRHQNIRWYSDEVESEIETATIETLDGIGWNFGNE